MPRTLIPTLLLALASACAAPAQATTTLPAIDPTPVPPPPAWLPEVDAMYPQLRVPGLERVDFEPESWWRAATPLLNRKAGFRVEDIGRSAEGRPLRHVRWGRGGTPVLLWSQMHGDESTGTMALADLFAFLGEHPQHPVARRIRASTTLHFLPLLNPDGAARFQRRNAQGIDINRDARMLATPEGRTLKALHDRVDPAFGFNLHDQQPHYRVGDSDRSTAIALLAPAPNEGNEVTPQRAHAIEVAAAIRIALDPYINGHIARWDETFNPRAFGDLTAQWGTSTVLIEAGGIDGDAHKQELRRLYFLGLLAALDSIASGSHAGTPHGLYRDLPENAEPWPDLRIDGGTLSVPGMPQARADLLVSLRRPLTGEGATLRDIGDLEGENARMVIDARGLYIVPGRDDAGATCRIATGTPACFHLSRDPEGREVVWSLLRNLDLAQPLPNGIR